MMTACLTGPKARVFCVDDNSLVIEALKLQLNRADGVRFAGSAPDAAALLEAAGEGCADIVLLDIDMPGKDPFESIGELEELCRDTRVIMYSGLLRPDFVDRAIDAGAWGYVAKIDGEEELLEAIQTVLGGSMGFSRSIRQIMGEA